MVSVTKIEIELMTPMSSLHFRSAEIAKERALNIHNSDTIIPEEVTDYIALSSTSIMLSIAALEATINELLVEMCRYNCRKDHLDCNKAKKFRNTRGLAKKYRIFPSVFTEEKELKNKAMSLVTDCSIPDILLVRHELTHCVPNIYPVGKPTVYYSKNTEKILKWYTDNQFGFKSKFWKNRLEFPEQIINAQFADWCFRNTKEFVEQYKKIVVSPIRGKVRCANTP